MMRISVRVFFVLLLGIAYWLYSNFSINSLWAPTCSINAYLDIDCPGCGGQRAFSSLLRGEFLEAFYYNELIYLYLGVLLFLGIGSIEAYVLKTPWFVRNFKVPVWFAYTFVILIIAFTVWRNIIK